MGLRPGFAERVTKMFTFQVTFRDTVGQVKSYRKITTASYIVEDFWKFHPGCQLMSVKQV